MSISFVAWCNNCKRRYVANAPLKTKDLAGNPWRWTRCGECGDCNLGVVDGDWSQMRPWMRGDYGFVENADAEHVIQFEEGQA